MSVEFVITKRGRKYRPGMGRQLFHVEIGSTQKFRANLNILVSIALEKCHQDRVRFTQVMMMSCHLHRTRFPFAHGFEFEVLNIQE